jgi:mannose-6-phosphate isomerase-like protein (cupin superfamily)
VQQLKRLGYRIGLNELRPTMGILGLRDAIARAVWKQPTSGLSFVSNINFHQSEFNEVSMKTTIPVVHLPREEMLKCVARFKSLKGSDKGLPDSEIPGCYKMLYNVVGFRKPDDTSKNSPVGNDLTPAISMAAGFGVSFIKSMPGNGPLMHNHDTNESFMPLTGIWRFEWETATGTDFIDLEPLDFISIPPGVPRRFENVSVPEGEELALMLGLVAGDAPQQEHVPKSLEILQKAGKNSPQLQQPVQQDGAAVRG